MVGTKDYHTGRSKEYPPKMAVAMSPTDRAESTNVLEGQESTRNHHSTCRPHTSNRPH